jgi:formamidopyrimidine-DNA glycosylase
MPELPEIETIRRFLSYGGPANTPVVDETIAGAAVLWPRTLVTPGPEEFQERVIGQTIVKIGRRGKFLIFFLGRDALLLHLRMSGDLFVESEAAPLSSHPRLVLEFESGRRLAFNDPRKFGRAWLVDDPSEILASLGPEPLDEAFTAKQLLGRLEKRRRQLKPLLLDQTFLAGLGNIYTDEALHRARLHPLTPSHRLSARQAADLLNGIRQTLEEGIQRNGASIDWVYRGGDFQNYFRVYRRTGKPCPVCGTPIERIVVGQRSTHFCPSCQPPYQEG